MLDAPLYWRITTKPPTIAYFPRRLQDKASIDFSVEQVVRFAAETRAKNEDWEVELGHGSTAGTK